jgi:hypothetical protein
MKDKTWTAYFTIVRDETMTWSGRLDWAIVLRERIGTNWDGTHVFRQTTISTWATRRDARQVLRRLTTTELRRIAQSFEYTTYWPKRRPRRHVA